MDRYITISNNTNYFDNETSKVRNRFLNPDCEEARAAKQQGYYCRALYEFNKCSSLDGQTFFYTLTYSDKNLPHFYGIPCFDGNDLQYLYGKSKGTSGLQRTLARKYGSYMRYFVTCEYGETYSRPHYHALFFVYPLNEGTKEAAKYPYRKITPIEFKRLIRKVWTGKAEGYINWKEDSIKGNIREGSNLGLVNSPKAVQYVAKYVCKDAGSKKAFAEIAARVRAKACEDMNRLESDGFYVDYILGNMLSGDNSIYGLYNRFYNDLPMEIANQEPYNILSPSISDIKEIFKSDVFKRWFRCQGIYKDAYRKLVDADVADIVEEEIKRYRAYHAPRPRASQGLGISLLDDIDPMNPEVKLPSGKDYKLIGLPLYYFRKIYCNVVKDAKGNNRYVHNDTYRDWRMSKIEEEINNTKIDIEDVFTNPDYYTADCIKYINKRCHKDFQVYADVLRYLNHFNVDVDTVYYNMSAYKHVYRDRLLADGHKLDCYYDYYNYLFDAQVDYNVDYGTMVNVDKARLNGYHLAEEDPMFAYFQGAFAIYEAVKHFYWFNKQCEIKENNEKREKIKKFHLKQQFGADFV